MSETIRGLVVAHGGLAEALVREAGQISGEQDGLVAVSNTGSGPEDIERQIAAALGDGPAVIFTDMPCGSCFFAAMRAARGRDGLRVVTGVNLPMLLDFLNNRSLPPAEGAARAAVKGTEAIRQP